ncbi:hypothetical protein [Actinopolymorpha singaporensis]|uniref:hypothetical protein n=1 Tax=Actinopolymorpha singaporensis TaxID=117157 RepID=UPI0012FD4E72|nr:hypothetical protein [Actinopolymorpha singaporensis]
MLDHLGTTRATSTTGTTRATRTAAILATAILTTALSAGGVPTGSSGGPGLLGVRGLPGRSARTGLGCPRRLLAVRGLRTVLPRPRPVLPRLRTTRRLLPMRALLRRRWSAARSPLRRCPACAGRARTVGIARWRAVVGHEGTPGGDGTEVAEPRPRNLG